jgi:hypothetical protein
VNAIYSRDRNHSRAYQCEQVLPHPIFGTAFVPLCAATYANGALAWDVS